MAKKFKFTEAQLRKLPVPTEPMTYHYDTEVPGLCLRILSSGTRTFVLRYRVHGKPKYVGIGRFSMTATPDWSLAAARTRASELKDNIRLGHDPLDDARAERQAKTVQQMIDRFTADHLPKLRPSSQRDYRNLIAHDFGALGKIRLKELKFADVDAWHRKISKRAPLRANLAHSVLRKMLNLAMKWEWIDKNPALGVERNQENKRQRYLSPQELARLTKALASEEDQQGANIIRLLLLTGARRGEVQSARWQDVDLTQGVWTKPASSTKQKRLHRVPLSAPACQLLAELQKTAASDWVFPAVKSQCGHRVEIQKTWYALCKAAKIKDAHIHDLRHTYASVMASAGLSLHIIGALLGHSNPSTTARYSHLFDDPLRAATERVGAIITGNTSAEVIPMRGRNG